MDLITLVVVGIALINLAVFAAGCALAIVRTRDEMRRSGRSRRQRDPGPVARPAPARSRVTH